MKVKTTKELKKEQYNYIFNIGEYLELQEGDNTNNDLNRKQIKAYTNENKKVWFGNINFYDEKRRRIVNDEESPLVEYEGQEIYNFEYTFCVPSCDETLIDLIREWNKTGAKTELIDAIFSRIDDLNGIHFIWS